MSFLRTIRGLLRGRWQVPVAGLALVSAWAAVQRLSPPPRQVSADSLQADLAALVAKNAYYDAADAAANLLAMTPALPDADRAALHRTLAGIIHAQELLRDEPLATNAELIIEHQQAALELGARFDAEDVHRLGQAHEWLGHVPEAVLAYRDALQRASEPALRRQTLQAAVRIMVGRSEFATERETYIRELLAQEGVSPAFVWSALQHAVNDALGARDFDRAREVLERDGGRFRRSDLQGYHEYLAALINVAQGRTEEALPQLDWIDAWWIGRSAEQISAADPELDRAGSLPVMNRWLRGRLALAEDRPQEALTAFDEALGLQSYGESALLVAAAQAEALAKLERHAAARSVIRDAVRRLRGDRSTVGAGLPLIRATLRRLQQARSAQSDFTEAARYLELALEYAPESEPRIRREVLETLGLTYSRAAPQTQDATEARRIRMSAGKSLEAAAALARGDEAGHRELLWASGSEYDAAGAAGAAQRMFMQFAERARGDQRRPQALLRLAQALAADGRFTDAIQWNERLVEEYPILPEAYRARLLIADALIAMGPEQFPEAQRRLTELLERGEVDPTAPAFREALFALGDLLYQQRRFAEAIGRIGDYLELYPDDAERPRLRFLLADGYRQSAYQLRDGDEGARTTEAVDESRRRFERAAAIFQEFLEETHDQPGDAGDLATLRRLALFARADCLFELNTPDSLSDALVSYRAATARYQTDPPALSAQVQIANIYLRRGKLIEAARAIEHARWLLGGISDAAFSGEPQGRAEWDQYLAALSGSRLFREVFAGTQ